MNSHLLRQGCSLKGCICKMTSLLWNGSKHRTATYEAQALTVNMINVLPFFVRQPFSDSLADFVTLCNPENKKAGSFLSGHCETNLDRLSEMFPP